MKIKPIITAAFTALSIPGAAPQGNVNNVRFQAGGEGISLRNGQAIRFSSSQQDSFDTNIKSSDPSPIKETSSHNGVGFKKDSNGISLEEGHAVLFYANQSPRIETITEPSEKSSDDQHCKISDKSSSDNGVGFQVGDEGVSLRKDQVLSFHNNKRSELS